MHRLSSLLLAALIAAAPAVQAHDDAGGALRPEQRQALARARAATAVFHDFRAALAAGYGPGPVVDLQGLSCIDNPTVGAMGLHYVNGNRLSVFLSEREPQALIYEPQADGSQRLVGAEYIVFEAPWRAAHGDIPPRLFGRDFHHVPAGNRYGLPAFYALHAWLWRPNPLGPFADWNPAVRCP